MINACSPEKKQYGITQIEMLPVTNQSSLATILQNYIPMPYWHLAFLSIFQESDNALWDRTQILVQTSISTPPEDPSPQSITIVLILYINLCIFTQCPNDELYIFNICTYYIYLHSYTIPDSNVSYVEHILLGIPWDFAQVSEESHKIQRLLISWYLESLGIIRICIRI